MSLFATYPPIPRLALSIGVIGHRPDRLPESGRADVTREIERVLDLIRAKTVDNHNEGRLQGIFNDAAPSLTIVSALAEGADRMVAHAGLARGMRLDVVLPFMQSEYANDFSSEASKSEFSDLVASAGAVLELPGDRGDAGKAYEAAGLTVVDQSDILIAVWDGAEARGRGGTPAIVDIAARFAIPVIHVDAKAAEATLVKWVGLDDYPVDARTLADAPSQELVDTSIGKLVGRLVSVPSMQGGKAEAVALARYLHRGFYRINRSLSWPLLQGAFGVRRPKVGDFLLPPSTETSSTCSGWLRSLDCAAAAAPAVNAYGFADAIAVRDAYVFRGWLVSTFVVGAGAVVCAALSMVFPDAKGPLTVIEVFLLALLVFKTFLSSRRRWLSNWIEAREVAERLRAALPLWALGARPANFHGDEPTWTGWYVRAVLRELGMRPGTLDANGAAGARRVLEAVLADQAGYHHSTAQRMKQLEHRMELFGLVLFVVAFLLGVGYLLAAWAWPATKHWAFVVAALSVALPAIASDGIRVIGEFGGISHRSQRAERELRKLSATIAHDEKVAPGDVARLRARAQTTADVLLGDVARWRVATESRGLSDPG